MNALLIEPATSPIDVEFARIVDGLTRRSFLGGALAATALAGLSACGGSETPADSHADTRQVSTIHGVVDVPAQPKRVVAVSFIGTANLLDLGVTPVGGVTAGVEYLPQYTTTLDAMPIVADSAGEVELEKISSLDPDLIVGSDWPDAAKALLPYDKLRRIALRPWSSRPRRSATGPTRRTATPMPSTSWAGWLRDLGGISASEGLRRDIEVTHAVREAYPDADIFVDANDGFTIDDALEYLQAVGDCRVFRLEGPFRENRDDLRRLRDYLQSARSGTLIADGEADPQPMPFARARRGRADRRAAHGRLLLWPDRVAPHHARICGGSMC